MSSNLKDKLRSKKGTNVGALPSSEDFNKYYKIIIPTEFGSKTTIDLTNILRINLSDFENLDVVELLVQDERIASILFNIAEAIKLLSTDLKDAKLDYTIFLSAANEFGKEVVYEVLKEQRADALLKTITKSPTKEDIRDAFLADHGYRKQYRDNESKISDITGNLTFLKTVFEILNNRSMTIKAILNKSFSLKSTGKDYI